MNKLLITKAEYKSEYHAGQLVAMAGANYEHHLINSNLIYLLQRCLWNDNCQVLTSGYADPFACVREIRVCRLGSSVRGGSTGQPAKARA
jgi:Putative restriction endonuclease